MNHLPIGKKELLNFINLAIKSTYAAGQPPEQISEKPNFIEYAFEHEDFSYRDSYIGYIRSRGMEVIRFKDKPIWVSMYGGGMTKGNEKLAHECFNFLKKALSIQTDKFSHRGAKLLEEGEWKHTYEQTGDVFEFSGYEEIYFKSKLVFFHRVIGGVVIDKGE